MNTIRTEKSAVFSWTLAGLALVLFALSLPFLWARIVLLPGDAARFDLLIGKEVSLDDLAALESSRLKAERLIPSLVGGDLATLYFDRAIKAQGAAQKELFLRAEEWQRRSLKESPADPYGWYRLAFLLYKASGPSPAAAQAWVQSMNTAPYEPPLAFPRLELGAALMPYFGENGKRHMTFLVEDIALKVPYSLAQKAKQEKFVPLIESLLADDVKASAEFAEALKKISKTTH